MVSQTIGVICAVCGVETKVNNRYDTTPFVLLGGELLFDCPNCKIAYDVPFKNANTYEKDDNIVPEIIT